MIWAALAIIVVIFGGLLWLSGKIGEAVSGKAAKEALSDVTNVLRPVDDAESQRLRDKYRRD